MFRGQVNIYLRNLEYVHSNLIQLLIRRTYVSRTINVIRNNKLFHETPIIYFIYLFVLVLDRRHHSLVGNTTK